MMVNDVMVKVVSGGHDCGHGSIDNPIESNPRTGN